MSFYTGRYVSSHGAARNNYPLRVGERTLGDHLRDIGYGCHLIGKTHMKADADGMGRLGISPESEIGMRHAECGFDPWIRDDGLWAEGRDGKYDNKTSPYNEYLKSKGYPGDNPWHEFANAASVDGEIASGWIMGNADKPANIREEDSETPWLTGEAIQFIDQAQGPWLAHLSYIKPHWPYIVPAPYHDMYGPTDLGPAVRTQEEFDTAHPVLRSFMENRISAAFHREDVRQKVIPTYMGLIKQCDDQLGRLLDYLEETGADKNTMIVLTSDHGDYLGDHWLGEKDLFHDPSVRIPLIIYDPRAEADGTRGTVCDELVEAIDLTATFVEAAGGEVPGHIVEGRSLMPFIHGQVPSEWREIVISETDYATTPMAASFGLKDEEARLFMVFDGRWKLVHAEGGFRPILFDLESDPNELIDRGEDPECQREIDRLYNHFASWSRRQSQRVTRSAADLEVMRSSGPSKGIFQYLVDGSELPEDMTRTIRGPSKGDFSNGA